MFGVDGPFSAGVLIVMIVFGAGIINNWIKLKREKGNSVEDSAEVARLSEEVSALKRRVATLERLAVDKDAQLREEFSRLA